MPSPSRSASRSSISAFLLGGLAGAAAAAALERRRSASALRRRSAEADERAAERALLVSQLVTAEQDERRRLAVALHDGPVQALSGIALMHDAALAALAEGRDDEADSILRRVAEREREVVQTLRDLSFALEPVVLRDQGFGAAVRQLADQIEKAHGIAVTLDVGAGERLGEKAKVALYQTIREAAARAIVRRSHRLSVGVQEQPDGTFACAIADDGVEERRRASIEAIEERARTLSGRVSVERGSAGGTTVLVTIPPYVAATS